MAALSEPVKVIAISTPKIASEARSIGSSTRSRPGSFVDIAAPSLRPMPSPLSTSTRNHATVSDRRTWPAVLAQRKRQVMNARMALLPAATTGCASVFTLRQPSNAALLVANTLLVLASSVTPFCAK